MKKLSLLFVFMLTVVLVQAQKRFELGVSLNAGLYFPEENELGYNIDKGLQTDIGLRVNYFVTKTTKLGTGVLYNYVKTFETKFYSPEPIIPTLNAIEIPLYIQQQFYNNWFIEAGVSSLFHLKTIETTDGNISTFGKWNLGGGIKLKKLAVSIQYSQNFNNKTIIIQSKQSSSISLSGYKRKVLALKLEYSLWNF